MEPGNITAQPSTGRTIRETSLVLHEAWQSCSSIGHGSETRSICFLKPLSVKTRITISGYDDSSYSVASTPFARKRLDKIFKICYLGEYVVLKVCSFYIENSVIQKKVNPWLNFTLE